MTGYHRTGGNLRTKRKPRKAAINPFANGQHFDERMNWTLADIKAMHRALCSVPKRIELIDESNKWNRQAKQAIPDRSESQQSPRSP